MHCAGISLYLHTALFSEDNKRIPQRTIRVCILNKHNKSSSQILKVKCKGMC